jgi:hypothetical protein
VRCWRCCLPLPNEPSGIAPKVKVPMANPFPGMNPYLEDANLWPAFHARAIACLFQILVPGLIARYRLQLQHRCYASEWPQPLHAGQSPLQEDYIEIQERNGDRLVTLVDMVSPANKLTESGRRAYLETRSGARAGGASIVEIDLVLQGRPTLEYSREGLPPWDYSVTVTRAAQPDRFEIYTATLQKRLPRFKLPLAADERDSVVDLNTAINRTFEQGDFASRIDYRRDPSTTLRAEHRAWLHDWLSSNGLRLAESQKPEAHEHSLPHEAIAATAYQLWERDGRPHGHDQYYWYKAIEELTRPMLER